MTPDDLGARLAALLERHHVPGAAVGVLHRGEVTTAPAVVDLDTGVEATPDTVVPDRLAQGKMWTATVLMQLVDEGRLTSMSRCATYLPPRSPSPTGKVSENVTLRHLLSHTSGIDGDKSPTSDAATTASSGTSNRAPHSSRPIPSAPPCRTATPASTIIGRVIEVVTGKVWDAAMRERLFEPLGLTHTGTLPEEALLHRSGGSHLAVARSAAAGRTGVDASSRLRTDGSINSTVADVLTFARLHLGHGVADGGSRLVAESSIRAMHHAQVESPDPYTLGSHWGLGVILFDWDGHFVYGHDGATIGQSSRLRIVPDADLAIALVANGGDTQLVYQELFGDLLAELAGIAMPAPLRPPADPPDVDLTPLAGAYQRLSVRYDLEPDDGRLAGTVTLSGPLASIGGDPVTAVTLTPVDATTFLLRGARSDSGPPSPAVFYEFHDGVPRYLHNGARANPRV